VGLGCETQNEGSSGAQIMIKDGRNAHCNQECTFIYSRKVKSSKVM
jgi:hypothetical protein